MSQNVQDEIAKQINEIEGEMSSAFEYKENEVKELRSQLRLTELECEQQKQTNLQVQETLKSKEKKIKNLEVVISRLEQNLNNDKVSTSKKIDTFLKEIADKSQTIKNLTNQLKEIDKLHQGSEKNENEIINLKNEIMQTKKILDEKELTYADNCNRYEKEIKLKSEKLAILQSTLQENEKKLLNLQDNIDAINLKNNNLIESEKELKMKNFENEKSIEELKDTITSVQNEKEMDIKNMKLSMEKNQLEFDELNKLHKEMLSKLNQDKLNQISEERNTESLMKDFNLLTEENAYLKKERQKILQNFHDIQKKLKTDYESLKSVAKEQLAEWSLVFVKCIKQLKAEYTTKIKLYHNNLIETNEKLGLVQKAYFALKSDCIQSLECFNNEIFGKYNDTVMMKVLQFNEELEKRKVDLHRLQEEIYRK